MITLKTLKWSNCFSYGANNVLQLDEAPLVQILGANGTGKSSIPLIIEEVLFNKNSKGVKKADIPNRYVDSGYSISLDFTVNDTSYRVASERSGAKLKTTLLKEGEDISSHTATNTYKTLQSIIGLDFKTFSQLVYQSTTTSLQFLSATDTNRKKFLIDLLSLEIYLDFLEFFKKEHKEVQNKLTTLNSKIDTTKSWLDTHFLTDATPKSIIPDGINTEEDEELLRSLRASLETLSSENEKILRNNRYKAELDALNTDILNDPNVPEYESYDKEQSLFGGIQADIRRISKELLKLEELAGTCPTCTQPVSASFVSEKRDELLVEKVDKEKQAEQIAANISKKKDNNAKALKKKAVQRDWEELFRRVDKTLPTTAKDSSDIEREIRGVSSRLNKARKAKQEIKKQNDEIVAHNARITLVAQQREAFTEQLAEAVSARDLVQNDLSNLDILKKAFSTNGILAYKIENLVKELEDLTNSYLGELSSGRFTIGFVVSNDKLNVEVTDEGRVVDISALSSGELARVNTATLIAIRKLMASISRSRINVLFLDEVIAVLDDPGREKLVETLLGEDSLNTYIVSHHWEHPLLSKLNVVKQDNISSIEV